LEIRAWLFSRVGKFKIRSAISTIALMVSCNHAYHFHNVIFRSIGIIAGFASIRFHFLLLHPAATGKNSWRLTSAREVARNIQRVVELSIVKMFFSDGLLDFWFSANVRELVIDQPCGT